MRMSTALRASLPLAPLLWASVVIAGPLPAEMSRARAAMRNRQPTQALTELRMMASTPGGREALKQSRLSRTFDGLVRAAFSQASTEALLQRKVEISYLMADVEHATGPLPRAITPKGPTEKLWRVIENADKVAGAVKRGARLTPGAFTDSPRTLDTIALLGRALERHLQTGQRAQIKQLERLKVEQDCILAVLRGAIVAAGRREARRP